MKIFLRGEATMGLFDIFKKKNETAMAESVTTNNEAAVK